MHIIKNSISFLALLTLLNVSAFAQNESPDSAKVATVKADPCAVTDAKGDEEFWALKDQWAHHEMLSLTSGCSKLDGKAWFERYDQLGLVVAKHLYSLGVRIACVQYGTELSHLAEYIFPDNLPPGYRKGSQKEGGIFGFCEDDFEQFRRLKLSKTPNPKLIHSALHNLHECFDVKYANEEVEKTLKDYFECLNQLQDAEPVKK